MLSAEPKVSVSILTYNQVDLVGQAIDSALMQETDFPFEIRIGDDFSDDGTRALLEDYRRRYPDRIVLNLQPKRPDGPIGRVNNMTNLAGCRGEYIALLDGDDYWMDSGKLARQVALLEADPGLAGAAHSAVVVDELCAPMAIDHWMTPADKRLTLSDMLGKPQFATSSFLFRAAAIRPHLPGWFATVPAADWALFALVARQGDLLMDARPMSAYRSHDAAIMRGFFTGDPLAWNRWERASIDTLAREFPESQTSLDHCALSFRNHARYHWKRRAPLAFLRFYAAWAGLDPAILRRHLGQGLGSLARRIL